MTHLVAIGLGASLGDGLRTLRLAVHALGAGPELELTRVSRVYWTAAVGGIARGPFLNAVVTGRAEGTPDTLHARLRTIEARLGRRPSRRWADRVVDLDLLLWDERVLVGRRLQIPHPRMGERAFVLAPLADVLPDARDPWTGRPFPALSRPPVVATLPAPVPR